MDRGCFLRGMALRACRTSHQGTAPCSLVGRASARRPGTKGVAANVALKRDLRGLDFFVDIPLQSSYFLGNSLMRRWMALPSGPARALFLWLQELLTVDSVCNSIVFSAKDLDDALGKGGNRSAQPCRSRFSATLSLVGRASARR